MMKYRMIMWWFEYCQYKLRYASMYACGLRAKHREARAGCPYMVRDAPSRHLPSSLLCPRLLSLRELALIHRKVTLVLPAPLPHLGSSPTREIHLLS